MPEPKPIQILLALLDEAFDGAAWHGPTLRSALRGVTDAQADWRPEPGRHSIRELTLHAAYWKHIARQRLERVRPEKADAFPLEGSDWFAATGSRAWKDDVRLLVAEHKKLRAAVVALPARGLNKTVDAQKRTAAFTIRGIAAHDVYHAGQITLIRKLQRPVVSP